MHVVSKCVLCNLSIALDLNVHYCTYKSAVDSYNQQYMELRYIFLSLGFHGWRSLWNFGFCVWTTKVENYPTFWETLQLPSSGGMYGDWACLETSYRTGNKWWVGYDGADWWSRKVGSSLNSKSWSYTETIYFCCILWNM